MNNAFSLNIFVRKDKICFNGYFPSAEQQKNTENTFSKYFKSHLALVYCNQLPSLPIVMKNRHLQIVDLLNQEQNANII